MKRIFLFLVIILLVTGCTNQYNLVITKDSIEEDIISTIPYDSIPKLSEFAAQVGAERDDPVTPFIQNDQYPFFNNNQVKYDKKVTQNNNTYFVEMQHNYTFNEFLNSRAYNQCFEKPSFTFDSDVYSFNMSGQFYCLYGNEVTINIKTDNRVISSNADSVDNNVYTWVFNDKSSDRKSIKLAFRTDKKSYVDNPIIKFAAVLFGLVLIGFIIYWFVRIRFKKKNSF